MKFSNGIGRIHWMGTNCTLSAYIHILRSSVIVFFFFKYLLSQKFSCFVFSFLVQRSFNSHVFENQPNNTENPSKHRMPKRTRAHVCVSLNPYLWAFDSMKYVEQIVFTCKWIIFVLIMKLSILNNSINKKGTRTSVWSY